LVPLDLELDGLTFGETRKPSATIALWWENTSSGTALFDEAETLRVVEPLHVPVAISLILNEQAATPLHKCPCDITGRPTILTSRRKSRVFSTRNVT